MINVSIIVPVYNQEVLVKKCLNSIPIRDDIEVVIVDDGSTDSSVKSIEEFINSTPLKTKFIKHEINKGGGASANTGIDNSEGEFIYQLDSDDYLLPGFNDILNDLTADINFINLEANDGTIFRLIPTTRRDLCGGPCKIIRRSLVGNLRYPENIKCGYDYWFTKSLLEKPHKEKYFDRVVYHYNFPREGSLYWEFTHE